MYLRQGQPYNSGAGDPAGIDPAVAEIQENLKKLFWAILIIAIIFFLILWFK